MDTRAVELTDVVLAYGAEPALTVQELSIPRGTLTAVIGPNGSGKSTLLGAITGLVRPRRGEVTVFGASPDQVHERVAHVLQEAGVNDLVPITVAEVVTMGRYARRGAFGRFTAEDRQAVTEALQRMDIEDLRLRHLRELSGGQRQRVHVAQGLAQGADLLVFDEPATGLDLPSQDRILRTMNEERRRGRTVIFATHDIAEASRADLVVLLSGRVVAFGSPEETIVPDRLTEAYRGHVHVTPDGTILIDDPHHHAHRHDHPVEPPSVRDRGAHT